MKKVVLICILSLSLCLGKPADDPSKPPATKNETNKEPIATSQSTATLSTTPTSVKPPMTSEVASDSTAESHNEKATESAKPDDKGSATKDGKSETVTSTTLNPKISSTSSGSTETTTTASVPTTTKPPVVTTKKPEHADTGKTVQARGFDGASFIGGIILTLGLLAIGFMGFKYYKNQTERNYHTL